MKREEIIKISIAVILILWFYTISIAQPLCDFRGRDTLSVTFVGDTINIWDFAVCGYCSSRFAISTTQSSDSIIIIQQDTVRIIATCGCIFNLCTSIVGIPAGTYTAVIYRDWHLQNRNTAPPILIRSIKFVYNPQVTQSYSYRGLQSQCNPSNVQEIPMELPTQFDLLPNYPNPFNPSTTIWFKTSKTEFVQIKVFDSLGKKIQTLVSEVELPGLHRIEFNAAPELSSGVYYYQMQTKSYNQTRSMVLVR